MSAAASEPPAPAPAQPPPPDSPAAEPPPADNSLSSDDDRSEQPTDAAERTTSSDLSDLLNQIADEPVDAVPDVETALTDPRDLERPDDRARVVVESTGAVNFDPEFASFGARAGGWLIDTVITTAAAVPGIVLLTNDSTAVAVLGAVLVVVGFALVAWLSATAVARTGQWIGNRVTSTKVVNVSNGELLDRPHALTRFIVRGLFSPIFFGGFIVAFTNTSRRTFHDLVADSIVTRPARATWSVDDDDA